MTAHTLDAEAPAVDIDALVRELNEEFLNCRLLGHAWGDPSDPVSHDYGVLPQGALMSTITNVALNFTKEELIARLRAVLPIAKERDKKAVAEHRAAERAYLDGWRDRLRECLKWGYKTAKESYFNIGGDFGRWGAPSCPEPLVEKIESAIAMVEMSNQSKYTLNHDGRNQNLYRLVTLDAARAAGVTYRQVDHWLRNGLNVGTNPRPGRGSARAFTASDVKLLRFLGDLARIAANNQHVSPTWIDDMRRVGAQVVDNPAILDRPYVFVAFDGTVTEHPAYGWVIAQGDNQ